VTANRRPRYTLLVGLLLSPLLADNLAGQTASDPEVSRISFVGNEAFSRKQLAAAIATEATSCKTFLLQIIPVCPLTNWGFAHNRRYLIPSDLPLDVLRLRVFYRRRGYREVEVDTVVDRSNGYVAIEFQITEGPPTIVRSLKIVGDWGTLNRPKIRRELPQQVDEPFNLIALDEAERMIVQRLRNSGYPRGKVLPEYFLPRDSLVADVTLHVEAGPRVRIRDISITGAANIGDDVIKKFLTFARGQLFREDRILESQRDLYTIEAVRYATINTDSVPGVDSLIDVNVLIDVATPKTIRAGVDINTVSCFGAEVRFTNRNFFGNARVLELTGGVSNLLAKPLQGQFPCYGVSSREVYQQTAFALSAQLRQAYFISGKNTLALTLFFGRDVVPDLFVQQSVGGDLTFGRRLQRRMGITVSYSPQYTGFANESADIYFCVNFGVCDPADINTLQDPRWLSPITVAWNYDRTNAPFSPTGGFYTSVAVERASELTGSDFQYVRGWTQVAAFFGVSENGVIAARIRAGAVEPTQGTVFGASSDSTTEIVFPTKRFYEGGANSVRGFGQNLLGPTVLVVDSVAQCPGVPLGTCVQGLPPSAFDQDPIGGNAGFAASLEYRLRLTGTWQLVGFVDVGQTWLSLSDLTSPIATPGAGVRYFSPIGPIRLDIAYNPIGPTLLPVVAVLEDGSITEVDVPYLYDPFTYDNPSGLTEFWRRLQLQLAIGEAF
jgi:outer membrane protein insertion porin family